MTTDDAISRLYRATPGFILVLRPDSDFTVVAASDDYVKASYVDASIEGRSLFEVFPDNPDDPDSNGAQSLRASLARVLHHKTADSFTGQRYDVRVTSSDGAAFKEHFWNVINTPVLDDSGEVEYIVHRAEEATAKGNRDAVAILESITEGFFTLDRQWRFDYVNREAHRILDVEPGALTGRVLWQVYPGLEGTEFERSYHRTMVQREKASFTAYYPNHDRFYEVTTFPAPEGVAVYFRDVTEQKRLQEEREALSVSSETQRRIFEAALDSTPDFFYVFDLEHRALYANAALQKTWGFPDVRGKKWMDLGYEQWHADMHDRELDTVITTRAPIRGEIHFTGTGGRRYYDYIFAPVLDARGEVVAVAGTTRDITDRAAAEQSSREQAERLAALDRSKDEFLATLSHELRNPLAPLRNAFAMLRLGDKSQLQMAPIHEMMERQVNHLVRLVDDLLEVSRLSQGTLSLRMERIEANAVIRTAIETSQPLLSAAGHTLVVHLSETPIWVDGDPVRLAQILSNVLNNAAKYTDDGGEITIGTASEDGHAVIRVRDNGMGITSEAMPRMFEMFNRGEFDSGRHQNGLGIGLALSRRLAEMHHGTLEVQSDGRGKGSEFCLRLPLSADAAVVQSSRPQDDASPLQSHVLIVDDNEDAANSLGELLSLQGAQVRVKHNGAEAIKAFAEFQPSVVLLDIGMPGMSGYEVARKIRQEFPERRPVLIAVTGWGQQDDIERAREAGFDHHLVKPADLELLQRLIVPKMA